MRLSRSKSLPASRLRHARHRKACPLVPCNGTCPPLPCMPAYGLYTVPGDGRRGRAQPGRTGSRRWQAGAIPGPDRDYRLSRLIQACRARAGLAYGPNRLFQVRRAPGPDPGPDRVFLSVALSSFCRARAGRVCFASAFSIRCRTRAGRAGRNLKSEIL